MAWTSWAMLPPGKPRGSERRVVLWISGGWFMGAGSDQDVLTEIAPAASQPPVPGVLDRGRFGLVSLDDAQMIAQGVGQLVAQPRHGSVDQIQACRNQRRHRVERREPVRSLRRQYRVAVQVQLRDDRQSEGVISSAWSNTV